MSCSTTAPSVTVQIAGVTYTQPMFTATKTIVVTAAEPRVLNEATKTHLETEVAMGNTRTSVISLSCSQPNPVSVMSSLSEDQSVLRSEVSVAPVVLGALLGVSLLLLAVVIAGWVCTCCIHKKDSEIPYR